MPAAQFKQCSVSQTVPAGRKARAGERLGTTRRLSAVPRCLPLPAPAASSCPDVQVKLGPLPLFPKTVATPALQNQAKRRKRPHFTAQILEAAPFAHFLSSTVFPRREMVFPA